MKFYLNMLIIMLSLGWIPMLIFFGRRIGPIADPTEIIVFIAAISILATSWIMIVVINQDKLFWKSIKELQFLQAELTKVIDQKDKEAKLYMSKCRELAEKILTLDK